MPYVACHTNFLAQTSAVPKHCTISNTTRKQCLEKLTEPVSLKHIANELSTSDSFVGRQLLRAEHDFQTNWHYLPKVLLMDEVKSTSNNKIKVIKRTGFGYRNFFRFRLRLLFAFRVHTKRALITK
ncbi:transposase [Lentilactobacillus buchneri]|nr:transposase [Lentilactobacillus sp. Egmn17]